MVRATRSQHHCPILIHYRPTQTCFVNGRCRRTRFSLGHIDVGAPEEGSNGYIVGNKNLGHAWGTDERGIFVFSLPINSPLRASRGSCEASVQPHSQANTQTGASVEGWGCYFSFWHDGLLLTSPSLSPAMHLHRHTDLANMNVYVYIYGFRYKNGWAWGRFVSAVCRPMMPPLSVNISRQPCQGFM